MSRRTAPVMVLGLPSLLAVRDEASRQEEPRTVVVVEPIAVREDMAAAMTGIPVETLRLRRKTRSGPPFHKDGQNVLYVISELRAWVESLPRPALIA